MFQNSYQGNSYFQLFDAKNIKERERPIFKLANSNNASKQFDKQLKGYTLDMQGTTNRLMFPRQEKMDLYLTQPYLNLQVFVQPGGGFSLEIIITDTTKTKRRIIFSHVATKAERKPFFVKVSGESIPRGRWLNLCIDVQSFIHGFPGQTYRSLDQIYISGACRLRKIYTTQSPRGEAEIEADGPQEKSTQFLPSHFNFPPGLSSLSQHIRYSDFFPEEANSEVEEQVQEFKQTEISSNASNVLSNQRLRETRKQFSTPKVEPLKSSNRFNNSSGQRKFLANTNSTEMMMRNRREEESQLQKKLINKSANKHGLQQPPKLPQQPKSVLTTTTKTNPELTKTRHNNTSLQRKTIQKQHQLRTRSPKKNEITKPNPWRNDPNPRREEDSYVKEEIESEDRDVRSANTTIFKKKNNLKEKEGKHFDPKLETNSRLDINTYSDSQYFELSQKFSTITDPKFFRPETISKMSQNMQEGKPQTRREEEQIEEAIEVDGASVEENARERQPSERSHTHHSNRPPLFEEKQTPSKQGFMEQHLRRMMGEIERPYTPPIHSQDLKNLERKPSNESKQLELIYDHVLNCYYDFKTNTYYELKP